MALSPDPDIIKLYDANYAASNKTTIGKYIKNAIFTERLKSPLGLILVCAICVIFAYGIAKLGVIAGFGILGLIIGVPAVIGSLFNLKLGTVLIVTLSFFILGLKRYSEDAPIGVVNDLLIMVMFFGLFIKQIEKKDWSFAKNPVSNIILIWIVFNLIEAANPAAESFLAWVYTVRATASYMLMFFIMLYAMDDFRYIKLILYLWIGLSFLGCLYCFKQEFIGFSDFEDAWVRADDERFGLIYIMGRFRKFSFFSDPMVFGFNQAYTSILCFVLLAAPIRFWKKIALFIIGSCMVMGMVYSGTRAAYVVLPVGILFWGVLTFKRNILLTVAVFFFFGTILVLIPTSNPNLVRVQTAFKPNDDPSYLVRKKNQLFIQPFIQSHPIGGGLGSVGAWGKKFSPWSKLSQFPPDSGFVRTAVEMGWLGLFLYCTLLFIILREGIRNHVRLEQPFIKALSTALLCVFFCLVVANFPQEAIGQIPTSLIFFAIVAMLNRLKDFDNPEMKFIPVKTSYSQGLFSFAKK